MRRWFVGSMLVAVGVAGLGAAPNTRDARTASASASPVAEPAARISEDDAVARVINRLTQTETGVELSHPSHHVQFNEGGLRLTPRRGGPLWRWSLDGAGLVRPEVDGGTVVYRRGPLLERYVPRRDSVQQQFVLERRPDGPLVIEGSVKSAGRFERFDGGWRWRTNAGAIALGGVTVLDARGERLPARMAVTRDRTRITVGPEALARAAYPVVVDPEIGPNDFRISDMGSNVEDAEDAAVAYNSQRNEYLVVWHADDKAWPLVDGEFEIFSARVDAATGSVLGSFVERVSDMGPDGDAAYDALHPAIAYNAQANEYFVVWEGDDDTGALVDGEVEIFGRRLDAAAFAIGTDIRLSGQGLVDGDPAYDAAEPAVSYNAQTNEYLVVWRGDDDEPGFADDEFEIYGQRFEASGVRVGSNFRISDMGPAANAAFDAFAPSVATNSQSGEYLVAWWGDDNTGALVDGEFEIFGQRLSSAGAELGFDFRISSHGVDGDTSLDAQDPAVAYNSQANEYFVVWEGDESSTTLVPGEVEIFGHRMSGSTGGLVGKVIRISDVGATNDPSYDASDAAVAYNAQANEYLVVWRADDDSLALGDNEFEIFAQRLDAATGVEVGTNDFRLSDLGPAGDVAFGAALPAVAYGSQPNQYLVVWEGDDDTPPLVDNEFEIFGQVVSATGSQVGTNDVRISHAGIDDEAGTSAAVAYNSQGNEYLVVWEGNDNTPPLADTEHEIFGQRVNAATGAEVGADDFRVSDAGPVGDIRFGARDPAVAYNPQANEYLVVWEGTDDAAPLVQGEQEIFGQRLSAATGSEIGADFRISDLGPNGDTNFAAVDPAVAYNSQGSGYLVVWAGDDDVNDEREIFGQLLSGTGAAVGTNDFRISDLGPAGSTAYGASAPAIAYNSQGSEYLVVWHGDDNTSPLVDNEVEVFGQRLSAATGVGVGANDFRISDAGPDGNVAFAALHPAVAYNPQANEYLVVWEADDDAGALVDDEFEIYAQRLDATGSAVGLNDFRLSDMGSDGNAQRDAVEPSAAYDVQANEYLVVWSGDDSADTEIYGQRVSAVGTQVGTNDFRLSDVGPDGSLGHPAHAPAAAYGTAANAHLIVWDADDTPFRFNDQTDIDIYGQLFTNAAPPTAVSVFGFAARRVRAGVELRWRSTFDGALLGFELWRRGVKVNDALVRARGLTGPANHRLVDVGRRRGEYRLVAVLLDGSRRVVARTAI